MKNLNSRINQNSSKTTQNSSKNSGPVSHLSLSSAQVMFKKTWFIPLEFRKLQPIEDTLTLQSRYNRMIVYSHEQGLIGVKMLQIRGKARRFLCSSFLGRCTAACLLAATGKARTRVFLLQGKNPDWSEKKIPVWY